MEEEKDVIKLEIDLLKAQNKSEGLLNENAKLKTFLASFIAMTNNQKQMIDDSKNELNKVCEEKTSQQAEFDKAKSDFEETCAKLKAEILKVEEQYKNAHEELKSIAEKEKNLVKELQASKQGQEDLKKKNQIQIGKLEEL